MPMHAGMPVDVSTCADSTHPVSAVDGAGSRRMCLTFVRKAGDLNVQTRTAHWRAVSTPRYLAGSLPHPMNECDRTWKHRDLYRKPSPFVLFGASARPEVYRGLEPPRDIAGIVSNLPDIQVSLGLSGST